MKPVDLALLSGEHRLQADVCVIGAGPVGLAMARDLAARGLSVALLERGGLDPQSPLADDETGFDAADYGGASAGRAFGFGGTSALWGGQLLPALAHETGGECGQPAWPIGFAELSRWYARVDQLLGIDSSPFEARSFTQHPLAALDWRDLTPRLSKWLPFARRNLARAWRAPLEQATTLHSFVNARVTRLVCRERRLERVEARSGSASLQITAPRVVLAAGALESTRLALQLFTAPHLRSSQPAALGCYLHDHLSIRVARLLPLSARRMQLLFAPSFIGGVLRSLRLELAPDIARAEGLPPAYAHIVAEAPPHSGFALVRDTLRSVQRGRLAVAAQSLAGLPRAIPELWDLAVWRAARGRLAFPRGASLHLHVDVQQNPEQGNRVYLAQGLDAAGVPRLMIDWRAGRGSPAHFHALTRHLQSFWVRNNLDSTARLAWTPEEAAIENSYDIYHPGGTTRMGLDAASACVDSNLKIFGLDNVYVASSSVLPNLGAANPTYTTLALGLRLAEHLAGLRQQQVMLARAA